MRLIAGLDRPDNGSILIDDRDVRALVPCDRRIGFVFQNYALFRHMSVARNIAFGLAVRPRRERPSRARTEARVEELLDLMQLSGFGSRFPAQLSGGQRQRVALARALAIDPKVLLLDEPFGALDAKVRGELREWLRELQQRLGLTTIFVTHDQHEAFQLAGRVAILNAGRIEQIGTPAEIHARPKTPFVSAFLGAAGHLTHEFLKESQDAVLAVERHPCGGREIDDPTLIPERHHRADSCAVVRQPSDPAAEPSPALRPSWTPRSLSVVPSNVSPAADLPMVMSGELWLIELRDAENELTSLECRTLTSANVIVYDRALADAVAAVLPLGGYAEPAQGDGLARSLQFVRDGWSVVRLIERKSMDAELTWPAEALSARLHEAGASADLRLRRLAEEDGRWLCRDDVRLGDADILLDDSQRAREVIIVGTSGGATPELRAVASNGLAG